MAYEGSRWGRRGTFSVEAAIILISFVVIASALAFAVMNMGYYAAQKTKDTMEKGVQEVSSALELDGSITAYVDSSNVKYLIIPVKTCVARSPVDLSDESFIVSVVLKDSVLPNIYSGTYSSTPDKLDANGLSTIFSGSSGSDAKAIIQKGDGDSVLELNEKAYIIICLADDIEGRASYDTIKVEFRSGEGATLSLSRQIPPGLPDSGFVDLG